MHTRRNDLAQARSHLPSSESQSSSEPSTSVPTPSSSSLSEPQVLNIAATKRSRRASLPHRLLSSLAPRTSTSPAPHTRSDSSATQSSQRKKWRLSRRFSKAPIANDVALREIAEPQDEQIRSQDSSAEVESEKGKAREDQVVDDFASVQEASTSASASLPDAMSTTLAVGPASDAPLQPLPSISRYCAEEDEDEVVIAPTTDLIDPFPETQAVPAPAQSEGPPFMPPLAPAGPQPSVGTTIQPPGRQFPPAGTLVVVQGVVHTTDVSHAPEENTASANNTNNSSNQSFVNAGNLEPPRIGRSSSVSLSSRQRSSSTPGDRLRNRLSGILPRPSSMLPSVPLVSEDGTSVDLTAADYSQQLPVDTQSSTATSGGTGSNTGTRLPTSEFSGVNPGSLSPSSIDVLGTLLRCAFNTPLHACVMFCPSYHLADS